MSGARSRRRSRALLRGGLALAGILVIAVIVWRAGWTGIRANLLLIGPWFAFLVALNFVTQAGFVMALRSVLEPRPSWLRFPRLYGVYLMGEAANYVVPVGGEAAKAHLLRDLGGGAAAAAAVAIHKQADLAAHCAYAVVGVGTAIFWFHLPAIIVAAALAGTGLLLLAFLTMTWALGRGAFSPVVRRLTRWKFLAARLPRLQSGAEAVDARITSFHTAYRRRFLAAVFFCLLGYCGGLLETWIVLRLLAPSAGWPERLAIEGLPTVLNNVLFFLPGKLGGAEGIRTGVFLLVGLSAAQGAAFAILRRTRELLWVLPGWVLLAREHFGGGDRVPARPALKKGVIDA